MKIQYTYCIPNHFLSYFQPDNGKINWTISGFLMFLRCFPLNYIIYDSEVKPKDICYYIHQCAIFYVYLKGPIQIVILKNPDVPVVTINSSVYIRTLAFFYKKPCAKKMKVDILQLTFTPNFNCFGEKISSASFKASDAKKPPSRLLLMASISINHSL